MNNFKVHSLRASILMNIWLYRLGSKRDASLLCQDEHYEAVKEWYDGYRFGNVDIYCPWDVICYCEEHRNNRNAEPKNYWLNTSGNEVLNQIKEKNYAENMRLDGVHTILKYGITCIRKNAACFLKKIERKENGKRNFNTESKQILRQCKSRGRPQFPVKRGELFAFLG